MNDVNFIGGWAETRQEEKFVLGYLQQRAKELGVSRELIARHTLAVDKRPGLELAQSEVQRRYRQKVARRYWEEKKKNAHAKCQQQRRNAAVAKVQPFLRFAAQVHDVPVALIATRCRNMDAVYARWSAWAAVLDRMELPSCNAVARAFGVTHKSVLNMQSNLPPVKALSPERQARLDAVLKLARGKYPKKNLVLS
jgi:hypothetical protein